jgi:hypothetical protein
MVLLDEFCDYPIRRFHNTPKSAGRPSPTHPLVEEVDDSSILKPRTTDFVIAVWITIKSHFPAHREMMMTTVSDNMMKSQINTAITTISIHLNHKNRLQKRHRSA